MVNCVYRRLARLLCRCLVVALLLGAAGAQAKTLLWLTADITPAARTALLKQQVEAHGWTWIHIDVPLNLPQADRPAMAQRIEGAARQAELILIDAPHPTAVRLLQGLAPTQAKLPANAPNAPRLAAIPPIWVIDNAGSSTSAPTNNAMAKPATAEARLAEYLRHGGLQNTRYAMDLADQLLRPGAAASAWTQLPPPKSFPNRGIYVPGAADFFERVPDLQAWMNTQPGLRGRPSVAVLVHRHHFVNGDTGWLDDLLNRFAGRGINAYAVFGQRLDANGLKALYAAQNAAQKVEQPGARPDVVIIHQLVSQPAELQALFTRWNTPALLAVPYRQGDVKVWQADKSGIRQTDVPYYLVQPEAAGAVDPLVIAAHPPEGQPIQLIDRQADALVGKAQRLIALQKTPAADKRLSLMVYNYPAGGANFGASFLNVPRSLESVSAALAKAGYQTQTQQESWWINQLQPLLQAYYDPAHLPALLAADQADVLPVRQYQQWFDALAPTARERITRYWGAPASSHFVVQHQGEAVFVIPRVRIGHLNVLPQPPRSETGKAADKAFAHKTDVPLSHHYLAVYLWARQADALIHFGTHGTQEWADGKSRGLDVNDDALLPLGDVPVIYPYIVDNLGEALTAKRRGRATLVSHRTPVLGTAGFSPEMAHLHELMHEWSIADDGPTKQGIGDELTRLVVRLNLHHDLGWSAAALRSNMDGYLDQLHPWLDQLAQSSQPRGLAVFGQVPDQNAREHLILQALRIPLLEALGEDIDETFLIDYRSVDASRPMQWLRVALQDSDAASTLDLRQSAPESVIPNKAALQPIHTAALKTLADRAQHLNRLLAEEGEIPGLLNALNGGFIPAAYGGDPIRNPDSMPTGRNLIGLDPLRLPTQQAYGVAQGLFNTWLKDWQHTHQGAYPERLVLSLWAGETLRHHGVMEAQALVALGVKPIWDDAGRPKELQLIPPAELGRPRIDVLLSITGSYRDQFPALMALVDQAVARVSAEEPDGTLARSNQAVARELQAQGVSREQAQRLSRVRAFGNRLGDYGTGIADAVLSDELQKNDPRLGAMFLQRMSQPYLDGTPVAGVSAAAAARAFGAQLRRSDAALLSRTSNLYGMVTSDDPFQYLGGLSAAARVAGKKEPLELYVGQLQNDAEAHTTTAQKSIALEMQSRYLHPGWVSGLQKEGYAGTLQVLKAAQFAWGWQNTAPDTIRPDHWQSFYDVFVKDTHQLGTQAWMRSHPQAYAQMIERLIQAERHNYWQPDAATRQGLAQLYEQLTRDAPLAQPSAQAAAWTAQTLDKVIDIAKTDAAQAAQADRVQVLTEGAAPKPVEAAVALASPYTVVQGARLSKVDPAEPIEPPLQITPWLSVLLLVGLLCPVVAGGWVQYRRR